MSYVTAEGDAWGGNAYKVYGDTRYTGFLMQHNLPLLDIFRFSAGTVVETPPLPDDGISAAAPVWRQTL